MKFKMNITIRSSKTLLWNSQINCEIPIDMPFVKTRNLLFKSFINISRSSIWKVMLRIVVRLSVCLSVCPAHAPYSETNVRGPIPVTMHQWTMLDTDVHHMVLNSQVSWQNTGRRALPLWRCRCRGHEYSRRTAVECLLHTWRYTAATRP